jgi:hypothetical protein
MIARGDPLAPAQTAHRQQRLEAVGVNRAGPIRADEGQPRLGAMRTSPKGAEEAR